MEEFNMKDFDLIDQAVTLVAQRKSGKSYLLTDLLFKTIMNCKLKERNIEALNVIIFCQSLIDANVYHSLYVYYTFIELNYDIYNCSDNFYKLVDEFSLKEYILKQSIHFLNKTISDEIIKSILDKFIDTLIEKNYIKKRTYQIEYNKTSFIFFGYIKKNILTKIYNHEVKTTKNRKYVIIIDDVNSESYKVIKDEVMIIYEQGRHHDISIIVIDQYIKSEKVPPKVRETSSHLIVRSFDEKIKREIMEICCFTKYDLDIESIKELIKNFYCIIIDYNDKTKLFTYKSPETINAIFMQFKSTHLT